MTTIDMQKKVKNKKQVVLQMLAAKEGNVNPFLTIMFYRISFHTWQHYSKKKLERRKEKARKAELRKKAAAEGGYRTEESEWSPGRKGEGEDSEGSGAEPPANLVYFEGDSFETKDEFYETISSEEDKEA